ncbi:LytR family transcriptional regulator [Nocardioides sp. GY 10127]|nr:LytR family transcriptional regulator [Nocardioides sp. GY 10127]
MAGVAWVTTTGSGSDEEDITPAAAGASSSATASGTAKAKASSSADASDDASASATESATATATKTAKPVKRGQVYVEVYNNSSISGLASDVAAKATAVGWNVVGADNWYGSIPSNTVYYPARLKRAAKLLARDLGISRVVPASDPMKMDRLTVILTGALS